MSTKDKIIEFLEASGKASVETLRKELSLSRQMIHRHLNDLVDKGLVEKLGSSPLVYYVIAQTEELPQVDISSEKENFLRENYLWISTSGEMFRGVEGFVRWAKAVGLEDRIASMIDEFISVRKEANQYMSEEGVVDATFKLQNTFDESMVDKLYYLDFYSLPKYGKTPIGQLVLHSKQGQRQGLIEDLSAKAKPVLEDLIDKHSIDAVAFVPPTIPRKIQFLKVLKDSVNLTLPEIILVKAYKGQIPIAQKTLSKLKQRIENARQSIHIKDTRRFYEKVLLIDDAVGSGSSMNEVAKKMLDQGVAGKVFGFALVGSYKGFDVISEV